MEMMTMQQLIEKAKVTMEYVEGAPENENFKSSYGFTVTLYSDDKQMTFPYYMGKGLDPQPQIDDVLNCLISDTTTCENARDFEDWAGEYGYDKDSRKAEKVYQQCLKQAEDLKELLGEHFEDIWNVEPM